ncbi:4-phosphoerythronate dehydrogenase, partial [Citrobacter sp. AAK_AS5]
VVAPTGIERVRFDNLLAVSDVLSVHASLTDASRGFIDKRAFARMKEGVYFVNTARGELIDESALLSALNSGRVAAAAMDVLSGEP